MLNFSCDGYGDLLLYKEDVNFSVTGNASISGTLIVDGSPVLTERKFDSLLEKVSEVAGENELLRKAVKALLEKGFDEEK